jgi:hypothetical protein
MPELQWDKRELLEHIGVEPELWGEDESYTYQVVRRGLWLVLHVWPRRSAVYASVLRSGKSELATIGVVVRGQVRRRTEHWGDFLDFPDCVVIPERYYSTEFPDAWDRDKYPDTIHLSIRVNPDVQVILR